MAQQYSVQYIRYQFDGSAARKVAPVAPLKTLKLPRVKRHKRTVLRIDPIAMAGVVISVVMFAMMCVGVGQLRAAQQELQTMTAYVDTLQAHNASLETTFTEKCDLEEIERTALALGLVPKNQVKHVTIRVPQTPEDKTPGTWDRFYTFLTGLFA